MLDVEALAARSDPFDELTLVSASHPAGPEPLKAQPPSVPVESAGSGRAISKAAREDEWHGF